MRAAVMGSVGKLFVFGYTPKLFKPPAAFSLRKIVNEAKALLGLRYRGRPQACPDKVFGRDTPLRKYVHVCT
jgi:hypothetical protein